MAILVGSANDSRMQPPAAGGAQVIGAAARPVRAAGTLDVAARSRMARHAAQAAGLLMLLGSVIDLGTLWILQREDSPQWEFAAISNTVDSIPRIVFALGFLVLALYFKENATAVGYRVLASAFLLVGVMSLGLGGLMAMSYFPLAKLTTQPEVYSMLRTIAMKTLALSGLYFVVTLPIGVLGLRRLSR